MRPRYLLASALGVPLLAAGIGLQWWLNSWWSCGAPGAMVTCNALLPVLPLFVMSLGAAAIMGGVAACFSDESGGAA